ncbi:MAG: hypothetical protein GY906_22315 [bacterium]|nr:hypothetical protein [bacterium]
MPTNEIHWFEQCDLSTVTASAKMRRVYPCRCGSIHPEEERETFIKHEMYVPPCSKTAKDLRRIIKGYTEGNISAEEFASAKVRLQSIQQDTETEDLLNALMWLEVDYVERRELTKEAYMSGLSQLAGEPELAWRTKPLTFEPGQRATPTFTLCPSCGLAKVTKNE